MCGIVAYVGQHGGPDRVLDALELLAYRAPDSSGIALLDSQGKMVVRRAVGTAEQLRQKLATEPFPPIYRGQLQLVVGHGRWAMVGAVTEFNAHPITDRGGNRIICENGSHNASLMLAGFADQERWWRQHGVPDGEAVHRTSNSSEVIVYEWERLVEELSHNSPVPDGQQFLGSLDLAGVHDIEERALRLALWRFRQGNAHACAFYSRYRPDTLYISSHKKPIALAVRRDAFGRRSLMAASDVNAALLLWTREEMSAAEESGQAELFEVSVIFLDNHVDGGEQLFVRIEPTEGAHGPEPRITISHYDGREVTAPRQSVTLSPLNVGRQLYDSYTEWHIAEIPAVMLALAESYVHQGRVQLGASQPDDGLALPGLSVSRLQSRFGPRLERLSRILLIGEGSSWRNGLAAAPLFNELMPGVDVSVYRPVEVLNLGLPVDPAVDLALEISWSGTTDSLLKVDTWLAGQQVLRVAITGRPQSDLGRRTRQSGGMVNVQTGVEISVATVKGYQAILMALNLLALQLGEIGSASEQETLRSALLRQLGEQLPATVEKLLDDSERRMRLLQVGQECARYNKFMVVGASPIVVEAELKIEELGQVVACAARFEDEELESLIERSARMREDEQRVLFIINATSRQELVSARPLLERLKRAGLYFIVHTIAGAGLTVTQLGKGAMLFISPEVSPLLQPLIDAPFFFSLAVALAYGRGLTPRQIDRPRNLAKSVTTTNSEPRREVESRREFHLMSLADFAATAAQHEISPSSTYWPDAAEWKQLLIGLAKNLQAHQHVAHQHVVAPARAIQRGIALARPLWRLLTGGELTWSKGEKADGFSIVQAGEYLARLDDGVLAVPVGLSSTDLTWLTAVCLMRLALAISPVDQQESERWGRSLALLPQLLEETSESELLALKISAAFESLVNAGYDKIQIIGGGHDYQAAECVAHSIRKSGFMAEALYTDSAWHGPLAAVGGPDANHDSLILVLATDPLFQSAALVDTQVYRARLAHVFLVVPDGNGDLPAVQGVDASGVWEVPAVPAPLQGLLNTALGRQISQQLSTLWEERREYAPH